MRKTEFFYLTFLCAVFSFALHAFGQDEPPPQLRFLEGSEASIRAVQYGAAGRTIVGANTQGQVFFWDSVTGQLIAQVAGHSGPILSLVVSPDGYRLATGGRDGHVKIFDLPTIHPLGNITGFNGLPTSVAISSDGMLAVTGDQAKAVRVWNVTNNQNPFNFGMPEVVTDVSLLGEHKLVLAIAADGNLSGWSSADGKAVATVLTAPSNAIAANRTATSVAAAGKDGVLRIIQWPPQPSRNLASLGGLVAAVKISHDGKFFLTGSHDQTVRLFDAEMGKEIRVLKGQVGPVFSAAISDDGELIASGNNAGTIKFWQLADGADRGTLAGHMGPVRDLAFHPTQPLAASVGEDGTVRVWQVPIAGAPLAGHTMRVLSAAISNNGKNAATTSADQSVRLWSLVDDKQTWVIEKLGQAVHKVAFGPQDKQLATGDAAGVLRLHIAKDGTVQATRGAHTAAITGLAYRADGKQLVTSGLDGVVKFWNLPLIAPQTLANHPEGATALAFVDAKTLAIALPDGTIQILKQPGFAEQAGLLRGLAEPASTVSFSPDAKLIAAGTETGRVKFWLTETGEDARSVAGHNGAVNAIAFHPKVPQVATAGADGTVRIWNLPVPPRELIKLAAPQRVVAANADGKQVIAGGDDKTAYLWKLANEKNPPAKLTGHDSPIHSAAFRVDGKQVATGDESGVVRFWNPADGKPQFTLGAHSGSVTSISFHAQNGLVATGGVDGAVTIWQVPISPATPSSRAFVLGKHDAAATTVAVTADSKLAISGGADKTLRFFDLATNKQTRSITLPESVTASALSPNSQLVGATGDSGFVRLFQTADAAARGSVGHPSAVKGIAFAPNSTQFASVGDDRVIRVWNLPVPAREFVEHRGPVTTAAVSPNGQLIASGGGDKTVKIWNFASGKVSWSLGHTSAVASLAWKQDGTQLATTDGNIVRLWNAADGKQIVQLTGHVAPVTGVAFGAGGVIVTGSADKTIRFWTVADGKAVLTQTLAAHDKPVSSLVALPDGSRIVSAGADGRVRTWNVADAKRGLDLAHGSPVTCLAISFDGKLIAVAGEDSSLKLYQAADGKLVSNIFGLAKPASSIAFSRDNLKLAAASADGLVRVWDATGNLLETLESNQAASVAFGSDHLHLVIGQGDNRVRIQRLSLVKRIAAALGKEPLTCVAYTPDGTSLVVGEGESKVKLYNIAQGLEVRAFAGNTGAVHAVSVSGDGKVFSAGADKTVRVWNLANAAVIATLDHPGPVLNLNVRGDGMRVASSCGDGFLRAWHVPSAKVIQRWQRPSSAVAML
ncbi:MAG: WD40 repeat domain-containing protein, partial [Planctomycetes bacterium]|nr:WD40 repeat domain-containing protein [Planctomycetota bacterium]